jgi:ribosome-associated protein
MSNPTNDSVRTACIDTPYIELDKLLKREDLADSGGGARFLIGQGLAVVNGEVEMRKRRKLYPGDVVSCQGVTLRVAASPCSGSKCDTKQGD